MALLLHFGDMILFLTWWDVCFLAMVCVVRVEGTPYVCQTDEVGEICVSSGSTGVAYFGLPGMTKNIFEVEDLLDLLLDVISKMTLAVYL